MIIESRFITENKNFVYQLHSMFPRQVQIYNQAVLKRKAPLSFVKTNKELGKKDLHILFNLDGEIKGHVLCSIDLSDKPIESIELNNLQSLFAESMNILLGKFLTNIEQEIDLMGIISPPKIISEKKRFLFSKDSKYRLQAKTTYEIFTLKNSYQCSVIVGANILNSKEV